MVWTRSDDREVYDRKIGELTDREYRERDALIAYIAREHPDTGFFHENEHKHAVRWHGDSPHVLVDYCSCGARRPVD